MNCSYKGSVALIGCGDWGKNSARTLSSLGALACIVDPTEKARTVATDLQVPIRTLEGVLQEDSIRGVVIATPTPTHVPLAQQALLQGKNVLVEKPLAVHDHEISLLQTLADQKSLTLMVGHLLLYHQAFQTLASWVKSGKLGRILSIETSRKNFGKIHAHEGVLWDLGPHDFSMILWLIGMPHRVLSQSLSCVYEGKPDIQTILMQYERGPLAQVGLSRLHPTKEQKVRVVGTKGTAVFDDTRGWSEKLMFFPQDFMPGVSTPTRGAPESIDLEPSEPLKEELLHFIDCFSNKKTPLSPAAQAQQILSLIKAAEASDHKKEWVSL